MRFSAVIVDVDGVLTDGMKYYAADGTQTVAFNVKDGVAFKVLSDCGVIAAVVSANDSEAVRHRMEDLQIKHCYLGSVDKLRDAKVLIEKVGINPSDVAVIGDDLADLPLFDFFGFSVAPADAVLKIKEKADVVLGSKAGEGVLREFCEKFFD